MARNEEKALSLLNRYLRMKEGKRGYRERPSSVTSCRSLKAAERFRSQVIAEISKKVMEIQNDLLEERRIRDLNDSINALLKEKKQWEGRIVELGGEDLSKQSLELLKGSNVFIGRGYYYFGAARNLKGVREFLERKEKAKAKEKDAQPLAEIELSGNYYGYMNPRQEALLEVDEAKSERKALLTLISEQIEKLEDLNPEEVDIEALIAKKKAIEKIEIDTPENTHEFRELIDSVETLDVPSDVDIASTILEMRKSEMLKNFE